MKAYAETINKMWFHNYKNGHFLISLMQRGLVHHSLILFLCFDNVLSTSVYDKTLFMKVYAKTINKIWIDITENGYIPII